MYFIHVKEGEIKKKKKEEEEEEGGTQFEIVSSERKRMEECVWSNKA
jgi:hypothetical protein